MGTVSIVIAITLLFAAANLFVQLAATEALRPSQEPRLPSPKMALEHPVHTRIDGMPRTRANRLDMQRAIGLDFGAPDVEQSVWPRDPRV